MLIFHKTFYLLLYFVIYFAIMLMFSCNPQYKSFKEIRVSIPEYFNITEFDIISKIPEKIIDKSSNYDLELTVFDFSGGAERINYTGDDNFTVSLLDAYIKILVKVVKNSEIVKTRIIKSSGADKGAVIENVLQSLRLY